MSAVRGAHHLARISVALASLALALGALEAIFRVMDGQPLTSLRLRARSVAVSTGAAAAAANPDLRYAPHVRLAPGVEWEWYREDPAAPPRMTLDPSLAARAKAYPSDPITPFFEFNREYLQQQACVGRAEMLGSLQDFFYFQPMDGRPYPTYRHLRDVSPPGWFVTNNLGWRGPEIGLNRSGKTIRIAFVGASTTVDGYDVPFSHPELIGHWLERWGARQGPSLRFEVINAGRSGIDSRSIAAIVRQELGPVDPDLCIFYEGANQFWPGQSIRVRFGRFFIGTATGRDTVALEHYSAIVRRLLSMWVRTNDGLEPRKPPFAVDWPAEVNEAQPDPHDARLPMDLPQVIRDLDDMRATQARRGAALAVSSFVWLVSDGMRLDPVRHANIYNYLNERYWPITYAHMRRMADFENRVVERYARAHRLPFIDLAREYPQDPDLFDDAIHMTYSGLRLEAWIYFQHLVEILHDRLRDGRLPRPAPPPLSVHPAFAQPEGRMVTRAELEATCAER